MATGAGQYSVTTVSLRAGMVGGMGNGRGRGWLWPRGRGAGRKVRGVTESDLLFVCAAAAQNSTAWKTLSVASSVCSSFCLLLPLYICLLLPLSLCLLLPLAFYLLPDTWFCPCCYDWLSVCLFMTVVPQSVWLFNLLLPLCVWVCVCVCVCWTWAGMSGYLTHSAFSSISAELLKGHPVVCKRVSYLDRWWHFNSTYKIPFCSRCAVKELQLT